ncbi:MAG TPA: hypothetical protein VGP93_13700, partial [Polyangiaceae bacterium]|nr:hypothetical protein [Polyangiaceae bacterium]
MRTKARPSLSARGGFPHRQALLASALVNVFEELGVGAAVHVDASAQVSEEWYPFKAHPDVVLLEYAHGAERKRWRYNERCFARVRRERGVVRGEHGGFSDFFVPLTAIDRIGGTLVVGPFVTARPTSDEVLTNWRTLTGKHGRMGDPEFARYLSIRLSTLT